MSNVLDDLISSAKNLVDIAGKKTDNVVEISKLKYQSVQMSAELKSLYEKLGNAVYTMVKSNFDNKELMDSLIEEIDSLKAKIDDVNFVTMPNTAKYAYSRVYKNAQSYVFPNAQELLDLVNNELSPFVEKFTMSDLDIMSLNSDGSLSSSTGRLEDGKAAATPPVQVDPYSGKITPWPGSETTDPGTTETGSETTDPGTTEPDGETTDPGTTEPGSETTDPGTTEPGGETTDPGTTEPGGETTDPGSTETETSAETGSGEEAA